LSHYENNYGGAVRRLNAIEARLAALEWSATTVFEINGLGRERLIAANSMILHEIHFEGLGGTGAPGGAMAEALARDFGSVEHWRSEFTAMGKALAGGSGWVLLTWSERLGCLVNQWAADHCHSLSGGTPILALDMYEHAYALDFGAMAAAYVEAFMRNIHWERVDARLHRALAKTPANEPPVTDVPDITVAELRSLLERGEEISLVDVCLDEDFSRRSDVIAGARFLSPGNIEDWAAKLPPSRPVVVYCVYGFQVSGDATAELCRRGFEARRLAGGIAAWHAMGGPTVPLKPSKNRGESS